TTILRVGPPLQQLLPDQPVEKPDQRDRLQLQDVRQIDLGQAFLLSQPKQHNPLSAGRTASFGPIVDVVAKQPRALDELGDELTLEVESHESGRAPESKNTNSQIIVCLRIKCTH